LGGGVTLGMIRLLPNLSKQIDVSIDRYLATATPLPTLRIQYRD
jgi:hypothetical protein